jgi:hypothetical protein
MLRRVPLILLTCALASGCASSPRGEGSWAYVGPDKALRSPPFTKERKSEAEVRADLTVWQNSRSVALQEAKSDCARATGESGAPSLWTGYSDRFVACMTNHGWTRGSSPL